MKARIKATGEIVEVDYIEGDYLHTSDGLYLIAELEGIESDIDYWTRLEHRYAGMAMQAYIIGNQINPFGFCESPKDMEMCVSIAHALVEKIKEERK